MQKAIVIDGHETLTTLNKWLENGAKVVLTCPMPSSAAVSTPSSGGELRFHHRRSALVITEGEAVMYKGIEMPYTGE